MSKRRSKPTAVPTSAHDGKKWAASIEDPHVCANVKRLTMRDGVNKSTLELELIQRYPNKPSDAESTEMLYLVNNYPLIKFAISEAEGFDLPLTEEAFWELPEMFVTILSEQAREVNKQYDVPFSDLAHMILSRSTQPTDTEPADTSTSGKDGKTE